MAPSPSLTSSTREQVGHQLLVVDPRKGLGTQTGAQQGRMQETQGKTHGKIQSGYCCLCNMGKGKGSMHLLELTPQLITVPARLPLAFLPLVWHVERTDDGLH